MLAAILRNGLEVRGWANILGWFDRFAVRGVFLFFREVRGGSCPYDPKGLICAGDCGIAGRVEIVPSSPEFPAEDTSP
jgi:hypothetical protein